MTHNNECCVYRSKDPLRNLKIRVTLQRATGTSSFQPRDDAIKGEQLNELTKLQQTLTEASNLSKEEVVINWQTKIFSPREFKKYTNPDFKPKEILEEHYKEECLKLMERNHRPGRIFTYIDSDAYEFYDEIDSEVYRAQRSDIPNYLDKNKVYMSEGDSHSNLKNLLRKRRPMVGKDKLNDARLPRSNIVNYEPNMDDTKLFQTKIAPYHTMYVMADLSSSKNTFTTGDECVLCSIKIDANGAIIVKPDFSSKPYVVQTGGFAKETYEYTIEHISNKITTDELLREHRLHRELYLRHSEYVKNLVGTSFKMPNAGVLKVHVFGEILWAKNFDYDDLHVYYQLELPRNWHIDPSAPLSGFTHTSRAKTEGQDEICYFSHPFEFDLFYKNDEFDPRNTDEIPKMPKILFEVASYDSWSRYRTEGYSWIQLMPKPGRLEETLSCWRPRGDSLVYEMRRFFIGGSPELEDISYAAVPSNLEGSVFSRLGFRTVTTGNLKIRLHTAFQSQIFMDKRARKKNPTNLLDKVGNYTNLNDFIAILDAFNAARNKMIDARENSKRYIEE